MDDNIQVDQLNTGTDPWYQALFECSPQPMYIYDAETLGFLAVNEAASHHYGFSRDEFLLLTTKEIRPPADIPALLTEIQELKRERRAGFQKSHVRQHRLKDGSIIHVETAKQLLVFNGRAAICVLVNDVTERVRAQRQIEHLAFFDELTGLPNRAKLRSDLQDAITQAKEGGKSLALLIVELTRFREINYTLGHLIGDELLKQVGSRIREVAGERALSARISNVQFGVVLSDLSTGTAIDLTGRLLDALADPLAVGEISFELGVHGGIAFFPGHGSDADALIRHADIALYRARQSGRSYTIYDAAHDPYKPQRLTLLGEFRKAIKQGQLQLYCQPKADIQTGTITSAEALVRWMHPDRGMILPDQFIPLIEPTELIQPLTYCMLEAAVRQCYEWSREGRMIPLAVNLSARNLLNANLPESIDDLLKTWGVDSCWMGLEITESSIMADPAASIRVLKQLHQMGLKLFIDDFGTGYSSLSYLLRLPVDVIKIDHSFTMNMIEDPGAAAIVKSTIEMAHNMKMKVVAEGTATRDIWESLARLGCDEAQGEYVSMPMPAMEFSAWLDQSSWAH
ncbi:putative bifunctional diguanylate cyclase/phosphodiesterase [Undibacterium arcticum]|uniref:Bifunctional diguanylate cyclase/phosphodiesterase n=1 Tax=Undibacterium arcticum TaxID=1762892 RepID=A0ABV7F1K5_9BURK